MKFIKSFVLCASLLSMQNMFGSGQEIELRPMSVGEATIIAQSQQEPCCDSRLREGIIECVCGGICVVLPLATLVGWFYAISAPTIPQSHQRTFRFRNSTPAPIMAKCIVNYINNDRYYSQYIAEGQVADLVCGEASPITICSAYDSPIECATPTEKTKKYHSDYDVTYDQPNAKNDYWAKLSLTPIDDALQFQAHGNLRGWNGVEDEYLNYSEKRWEELDQA